MAGREGVFAEPASAASLAGVIKSINNGRIKKGSSVVCVLTGNGLKDPDNAIKIKEKQTAVKANERDVLHHRKWWIC